MKNYYIIFRIVEGEDEDIVYSVPFKVSEKTYVRLHKDACENSEVAP